VGQNKRISAIAFAVMMLISGCSKPDEDNNINDTAGEMIMMDNKYVQVIRSDGYISVCFDIENDEIMEIGNRLNEVEEQAYMNGYNWDALIGYYVNANAPELLVGFESDPEAGMYSGYYDNNDENMAKAEKLSDCILKMIEDPDGLCEFVSDNCEDIPWD